MVITEIRFMVKINLPGTTGAVGRVDMIQARAGYTIEPSGELYGWVKVTNNADHSTRVYPQTVVQSVATTEDAKPAKR